MASHAATNHFGNELERQIKLCDIPDAELARRVHVVTSTIWRWKTGSSHPSAATKEKIAKALGVPVSVFADRDSAPLAEGMKTAIAEMETTLSRLRETANRIESRELPTEKIEPVGEDGLDEAEGGLQ